MNDNTNWLPKGHESLYALAVLVVVYAIANAERFCMDKTTRLGDWFLLTFMPIYTKYTGSYAIWKDPATRTSGASIQLTDDEEDFIPIFRELCGILKALPMVTNADLDNMGLPQKPSHEHHPTPVADKAPSFNVEPIGGNRLRIHFFPEGAESKKGKPHGQHGAEIKWDFTDAPEIDPDDLTHSSFDTNSPFTLDFHVKDIGKRIAFALRWENNRGIKGPWSTVIFDHVP
ncbi:MAG: hypothetical protein LBJ39_01475 [Tannerellaceae bacterium]|jgi:hypothetical protein|nr:hypothetical protein [Tannerellaceae bacterium]